MKILLTDDHALFREGMRLILARLGDDTDFVEAGNCQQALELTSVDLDIQLILLDIYMPGIDGLTTLDIFSEKHPTLTVIVLSSSESRVDMQRAINSGALGYLLKSTQSDVVVQAVKLVLAGGIYIPPEMVSSELNLQSPKNAIDNLTPRQLEVVRLLIKGCSNKEIARYLDISVATVKAHIYSIMQTLSVSSRTEIAAIANELY